MSNRLSALDATFLELEEQDQGALMSVGGVLVFDAPSSGEAPTVDELVEYLAPRLGQLPRYSQRLSAPRTGGWSWPRWVEDERFDLRDHIVHVALPAPGSDTELCEWTAEFYSHPLDRSRPLWQMALIDGLADGAWALAHKAHHCLDDGVGSADVLKVLLDSDPHSGPSAPSEARLAHGGASVQVPLPAAPEQAMQAGWRAARASANAVRHPRQALSRARRVADLLVHDELVASHRTSLTAPIGSSRRFAVVAAELAELKEIRRRLGGTVNDVVLAACATGLRNLLLSRGEKPPVGGLRVMVPMNVRDGRTAPGNHVSSWFVELPVAEPFPLARHRRIVSATLRRKRSQAATGATTVLDLAELTPPVFHAVLARSRFTGRLFDVTITNVPGPQTPLYALGAELRHVYPVVPLASGHTVGIAVFSYNGRVMFGVLADSESTPDIGLLALGIAEGIDELLRPLAHSIREAESA